MKNIFNFEYELNTLNNRDESPSKFKAVYGQDGILMHTIKGGKYNLVQTNDVSIVADTFLQKGYDVTPFIYSSGEVIGLNVPIGQRMHEVGDRRCDLRLTIKNNGTGVGYLSAHINRLVCTNGMTVQEFGNKSIVKVPHTADYRYYLELAQNAMVSFENLLSLYEDKETILNKREITREQLKLELNRWFFNFEFPVSQKPNKDYSFTDFRKDLYENPESIKCIERYKELMISMDRELGYNEDLDLECSSYTVFATVSNYLSRRIEKSGSTAPIEIQQERVSEKMGHLLEV
jgi:Domain of unknown function (DUF932)